MREKISSRLRLLLCFGVIVFISLVSPSNAEAHIATVGGREPGTVYDGDNPWDGTHVGWFTHDKKVGSKAVAKWYTKGYYVTTYPLLDYTIPSGALLVTPLDTAGLPSDDCTESGYVDTLHLFDRWKVTKWCMDSGASIADDGTMTVYAQPVIGTKTKKKGNWVDDGKTIMSLTDWVNAKPWANTSTFKDHYNKPLHIVFPPSTPGQYTNVQYQALNDGNGYTAGTQLKDSTSYAFNLGSVHSYNETGLMPYMDTVINGETRRFVLAGVRVDKPEGCVVGTSGRFAVSTGESNLVEPSGSYATVDASLSDAGAIPGSGWTFRRDYSSVHSYVNGCNFRVSTGTTITYLYAEVKTICKLYTAMRFDGYNTFNVMNAESPYTMTAGGTFDLSGEAALVPATTSYKGYVWELVQASFYKKGANILSIPTAYVANDAWGGSGSMTFRTMNIMGSAVDYNAWQQCVSDNNRVKITTSENAPADYVYAGRYQVAPPQIELSYYKDSKGRYHLFSYTSGGVAIDITQEATGLYRKNTWLDRYKSTY